jgi:hypothetical protein
MRRSHFPLRSHSVKFCNEIKIESKSKVMSSFVEKMQNPDEALKVTNIIVPIVWLLLLLPRYSPSQRIAKFVPLLILPISALYVLQLLPLLKEPQNKNFVQDMFKGINTQFLLNSFGSAIGATCVWLHMCAGDLAVGYWLYQEGLKHGFPYLVHVVLMLSAMMFNPLSIGLYVVAKALFGRSQEVVVTTHLKSH